MGASPPQPRVIRFGPYRLDVHTGEFYKNGSLLRLQPQPFKLLVLLAGRAGELVTHEEIREHLWGKEAFVDFEKGQAFCIGQIRAVLGDDAEHPRFVETLPRRGYRFIAAVERDGHTPAAAAVPVAATGMEVSAPPAEILAPARSARPRWFRWVVAGGVIALAAVAAFGLWHPWEPRLAFAERDWVLIAQFENRTGEPVFDGTLEYALERELSNSQFVNVAPRERIADALRLMKQPPDTVVTAALGREICLRDGGIRALLTGRAEKLDSTYLLTAQLVDPADGTTLRSHSERAVGQRDVVLALHRLARRVRKDLGEQLPLMEPAAERLPAVTTSSLRALQLYSQGMQLMELRNVLPAGPMFEQAVAEDPGFASAHLALAYVYLRSDGDQASRPHFQKAFELASAATEWERLEILGAYHEFGDLNKAIQAYEALLQVQPSHHRALASLAFLHLRQGRADLAAPYLVRRADLRPHDFISNYRAWEALAGGGDLTAARPYYLRARSSLSQTRLLGSAWAAYFELIPAREHWSSGDVAAALTEVDRVAEGIRARPAEERSQFVTVVAEAYLTLGKIHRAEELLQERPHLLHVVEAFRQGPSAARVALNFEARDPVALARAGRVEEAERVLAAREKQTPDLGMLEIFRGEIALARRDPAKAIPLLRDGLNRTVPGSPQVFAGAESLAFILEQQGDLPAALRVLEDATRKKPDLTQGWLGHRIQWKRAELCRRLGRHQEAQAVEDQLARELALGDTDHPLLRNPAASRRAP